MKSNPLNEKQLAALNELVKGITPDQIVWLNGYLEGTLAGMSGKSVSRQQLLSENTTK